MTKSIYNNELRERNEIITCDSLRGLITEYLWLFIIIRQSLDQTPTHYYYNHLRHDNEIRALFTKLYQISKTALNILQTFLWTICYTQKFLSFISCICNFTFDEFSDVFQKSSFPLFLLLISGFTLIKFIR